jgi:hypothetical protein
VLFIVTLLVTSTAAKAPSWLLQLLGGAFGGWLFAGVIWELQFERKMAAQLAGLVIGLVFTLVAANREWITTAIRGKREPSAPHHPDEERVS